MLVRFEVGLKPGIRDVHGEKVARKIHEELEIPVEKVTTIKVFTVDGLTEEECQRVLDESILHDPVLHTISRTSLANDFDWNLEIGFRPGVTDNEARTASSALGMVLKRPKKNQPQVYTSQQYCLSGRLEEHDVEHIAKDLLANDLIQRFSYQHFTTWQKTGGYQAEAAKVTGEATSDVAIIPLSTMTDQELLDFSKNNVLALTLEEMHGIKGYYSQPEILLKRKEQGLPADPTDAEIEALAQTWSEHCKHKIFASKIMYRDQDKKSEETIDSLFDTYIKESTRVIRKQKGDNDICLSVFKDNAGVIRFTDTHNACIKVETHNSPSALDPYGGALTGIVGVNRDPMGTGLGSNLLCNTDVFCFASPFYDKELPPRLLHPKRVMEGVREGVEHGGNKSGIPTVNGGLIFDQRYLGKPLVFCGTVGIMPAHVKGQPSYEKQAMPGDSIIMLGGRIGKDGIHGATFSSEELHEGSPATAVQIGDPFTQRKMYDFIMRARDLGLYNAITDNGAGGLSSSVGEMAQDCGGCLMDLAQAPLKYDGLRPWEILLSEAQERMTVAVPAEKKKVFLDLAEMMDVEASDLGVFTDSGYFHVMYADHVVAYLAMDFLHDGVPQLQLEAEWNKPELADKEVVIDEPDSPDTLLLSMLGRLNICSREYIIRQYDHEVQGGSVIKPLVGMFNDGPADAAVVRPILSRKEGLVVSNGICPKFSDYDTYWMMANAIDEAVRNAVAVGADISSMAGVDNFCWCDPVQSEKTPDGRYKLAQLVRANKALAHFCQAYGIPCISGKDSMKNDYTGGGEKISIPPTVLFSLMGIIPDVSKTVTSDFKNSDESLYILGLTSKELGGSELLSELGSQGGQVPQVDVLSAKARYRSLFQAIAQGVITSCHDLSDGGLGVALAEMAMGGRCGADVDLTLVPVLGSLHPTELLYSESASRLLVTVHQGKEQVFESFFAGQCINRIGKTTTDPSLLLRHNEKLYCSLRVADMVQAWQQTFDW